VFFENLNILSNNEILGLSIEFEVVLEEMMFCLKVEMNMSLTYYGESPINVMTGSSRLSNIDLN